jgi:hypothetical protein
VKVVLEVERDVFGVIRQEYNSLSESVRIPNLIEDIRVPPGHIRDDQVSFCNLIIDALEHGFFEDLFIDTLAVITCISASGLDTENVSVGEIRAERHQHEREWFWLHLTNDFATVTAH